METMQKLRANQFEINYLEGWSDSSTVVLIGPERPVFTPNVQVNQEPVPTDEPLVDFFAQQRRDLASLDGFELIDHGDRQLAGFTALQHTYSWKIPDSGEIIRQRQVVVVRNGVLYTITCSALDRDWDGFEGAFEMTIAGFAFV